MFQLVGTAIAALLYLPVPAPVVGMGLLLAWLALRFKTPASLEALCDIFLRYLPLLFVPAAIGVSNYRKVLLTSGLPIIIILVFSTLAALLAVLTGITGAVIDTPLFNSFGFSDWLGRGFAFLLLA